LFVLNHIFLVLFLHLRDKLILLHTFFGFLLLSPHQLIERLRVIVVNVFVYSRLQPLHQLLLNLLLDIRSNQSLGFSYPVSSFGLLLYRNNLFLALQLELPHLNDHLPQFGQPLLAFVDDEGRPIDEMLIDFFKGFLVRFVESDFFPELVGKVSPFCSFHVQVANAFLLSDGGILGVGERT
jgi:hypothetical protein